MKNITIIILLLLSASFLNSAHAQKEISWGYFFDVEQSEIVITAKLKEHWHLYSQYNDEDSGPVPTVFSFSHNGGIELIDGVVEPEPIVVFDKNFDAELKHFENEVSFRQRVKVKNSAHVAIEILYMLCDDKGCLPPTVELIEMDIPQTMN
jgi:hypothetical protein